VLDARDARIDLDRALEDLPVALKSRERPVDERRQCRRRGERRRAAAQVHLEDRKPGQAGRPGEIVIQFFQQEGRVRLRAAVVAGDDGVTATEGAE
jgi:hypothetical protein